MRRAILGVTLLALASCAPEIPDATYVCTDTTECPPSMSCFAGLCVREPGDAGTTSCRPLTCADRNARCGMIGDGCGGALECGTCVAPEICGGFPDAPNVCGCLPRTQCTTDECGEVSNGCGGTLSCGGCVVGECVEGRCGCTPPTCGPDDCGALPNACGGAPVDCGGCEAPDTCGGGGVGNRCGLGACTPTTCHAAGASCGQISDGCAGVLSCGTCADNERCTSRNLCECVPNTCASPGAGCGAEDDGCGGTLSCTCTAPQVCDGTKTCACPAPECEPGFCGVVGSSPCVATCACGPGLVCDDTKCVCSADAYEPNETAEAAVDGGDISSAIAVTVEAIISTDQDRDWFRHELLLTPPTGPYVFDVRVADVPAGARFALGVYPICVASTDVAPTCTGGTPHPAGALQGCRAEGVAPRIQVQTDCAPEAVLVAVSPVTWADACTPYSVTTQLTVAPR